MLNYLVTIYFIFVILYHGIFAQTISQNIFVYRWAHEILKKPCALPICSNIIPILFAFSAGSYVYTYLASSNLDSKLEDKMQKIDDKLWELKEKNASHGIEGANSPVETKK